MATPRMGFNVREGFTRKEDTLSRRILTEPLSSGVSKGQRLTQAQLNHMLGEYYTLRGWDKTVGAPTKKK